MEVRQLTEAVESATMKSVDETAHKPEVATLTR